MNLREYIHKHAVKQAVLARRAEVSQPTLIRAIRGQYITYRTAQKISKATNGEVSAFSILELCVNANNDNNKSNKKKNEKESAKAE